MVINDGDPQRSRVLKIAVNPAEYPTGAVLVRVTGAPMRVIPDQTISGGDLVLTFNTDPQCEAGSLPDGRWAVVPVVGHLHRLFGDGDGNAAVGQSDFAALQSTFGLSAGDPGYLNGFDSDGNAVIDSTDFLNFANRYRTSI